MRARLFRFASVAVAAGLVVGACAEGDSGRCGGDEWCYGEDGAYDPTFASFYCGVFLTRERVAGGEIDVADLPAWADPTLRDDGTPVIVDLATVDHDDHSVPVMAGEIVASLLASGMGVATLDVELGRCTDGLTQEAVESEDGPRQDVGPEGR